MSHRLIGKIGKQHSEHLYWAHSPTAHNEYIIYADDMKPKDKNDVEGKMKKRFPNLAFKFATSNSKGESLSANVSEYTCERDQNQWKLTGAKATCEIILQGTQPHKDRIRLFAITSAHLLLKEEEKDRFENVRDLGNQQDLTQKLHTRIREETDKHVYKLVLGTADPQSLQLTHPPLFVYCIKNIVDPDQFMTDIALFPIEPENIETLRWVMMRDNRCRLSSITYVQPRLIEKIGKLHIAVFAKQRVGELVPSVNYIGTRNNQYGLHISFKIRDG